jgi:hypothetical protein
VDRVGQKVDRALFPGDGVHEGERGDEVEDNLGVVGEGGDSLPRDRTQVHSWPSVVSLISGV